MRYLTSVILCLVLVVDTRADDFVVPKGQRQLFVDDVGVAKITGLTRRMHSLKKKGAVIRPVIKDKQLSLQTRSPAVWDPVAKVYKFWLITPNCFVSKDGLHWTETAKKPNRSVISAIIDPHTKNPNERFKGLVSTRTGRIPMGSPDGITWKPLNNAKPIPSQDESNLSYDSHTRTFISTVKHRGPYGRSVFLSTSKDFLSWTKPELIFHADKKDQELGRKNIQARIDDKSQLRQFHIDPKVWNVQVYNMGLFRYESVYFGTPAMFHSTGKVPNYPNTDGFHLIALITSRDMKKWQRLGNRKPFIGLSPVGAGAYDLTQMIGPSAPIVKGDELWFYYTGLKYRASFRYIGKYPSGTYEFKEGLDLDGGAICLGTLRRDGFVSLDAASTAGSVTTEPFKFVGDKVYVNVDVLKGEAVVEALRADGKVIAKSKPIRGDQPRAAVQWKSGTVKTGTKAALRITVTNGSLYSYWIQ